MSALHLVRTVILYLLSGGRDSCCRALSEGRRDCVQGDDVELTDRLLVLLRLDVIMVLLIGVQATCAGIIGVSHAHPCGQRYVGLSPHPNAACCCNVRNLFLHMFLVKCCDDGRCRPSALPTELVPSAQRPWNCFCCYHICKSNSSTRLPWHLTCWSAFRVHNLFKFGRNLSWCCICRALPSKGKVLWSISSHSGASDVDSCHLLCNLLTLQV